jgi:hypothetical protein
VHAASAVEFGDVDPGVESLESFGLFEFGDPFAEVSFGEFGPRPAP